MDSGSTSPSTTTGSSSEGTTSTIPTTTSGDPESSSSSSGEPLDGPGCGVVPTCDRGELVGSMRVESAAQIDDIAGYTSVTGWLEIAGSDLECLDFLACLTTVGRDVHVSDNAQLRSLDGTDAIVDIGEDQGAVIVAHNDAMTELDGFAGLTRMGSLVLSSNASLERIAGFDALEVVEDELSIRFHPNLHDLGPLEDLRALGGFCQITNNPSLCLSETFAVCGDLEKGGDVGNTENNDPSCIGDAPPGFIPSDGGPDDCSVWDQDCPPGEKCTWWANDGGNSWNDTRCVPVDPAAGEVGDSCTVQGSGVTGIDSCDVGLMCWGPDPETLSGGECVSYCLASENNPYCPHVDAICNISGSGFGFCNPLCDPLAQDCAPWAGCYDLDQGPICAPDASGDDLGAIGDPCTYINACDPGLACAGPGAVPGCAGAMGCCSPWCDAEKPDCPFPEQECVPFYDPADAPWGLEHIGVCSIP